ncbi:hypothetical protein MtrunA17_Chr4g0060901 [Medicago truncatula]|uniref:Uncharacterized protein n=1 Tax=Medicago truncatula TaxID=3880 RepID=A0A072V1G4_MEDTR|nr:hypothetical protein MTR_4g108750 [Medicago truncatula]RHN63676.1 hypothetical protein MtrunA17_Chr4g0060901 [Medicago truncatula]
MVIELVLCDFTNPFFNSYPKTQSALAPSPCIHHPQKQHDISSPTQQQFFTITTIFAERWEVNAMATTDAEITASEGDWRGRTKEDRE